MFSVERHVIRIFAHYGIDHHPITGQAFIDDPGWQRRRLYSLFLGVGV
jgi:hypothetical protein